MDVELAHEVLSVFVHRFEAHAQFCGDLFVGLAFAINWSTSTSRELSRGFLLEPPSSPWPLVRDRGGGGKWSG